MLFWKYQITLRSLILLKRIEDLLGNVTLTRIFLAIQPLHFNWYVRSKNSILRAGKMLSRSSFSFKERTRHSRMRVNDDSMI